MVDGFDEISPSYKETVIEMLQVLKQTSLQQLWVTTRPHLKEELEDRLQQLSYTLQPFSEVEQVEFLKQFWLQTLNPEARNQHRFQIYATALIRKLAQSISDKNKEFTGIPSQTRILAEAFKGEFNSFYVSEKSEPLLAHKLDLPGLYRRCIERKYDIYYTEKSKTPGGKTNGEELREGDLKYLQVEHQRLALEELFNEDQVTFLETDDDSALSAEELARIGIVQRTLEGKPQFIHRTFAEYFVAEFLIKQLTKKTKQHEQVKELLLNVVLLKEDCQVIRAFLDGLLGNTKPPKEALREYGEKIDDNWHKREVPSPLIVDTTALHEAAKEDNVNILGFVLDSLKSGEYISAATKSLLAKDHQGNTAWHKAAERNSVQALKAIWEWAEEVKSALKYSLLTFRNKDSKTASQLAAEVWRTTEVKKQELKSPDMIKKKMLLSRNMYGINAWHLAANAGSVEILGKMWDWAKIIHLEPQEMRDELFSKDNYQQTAWHKAAELGHVEVLDKLWDLAKELQLKPEELRNELLLSKDKSKKTAWQKAAERGQVEILEKLWNWATKLHLNPEEIRNEIFCRRTSMETQPGTRQQTEAKLKY